MHHLVPFFALTTFKTQTSEFQQQQKIPKNNILFLDPAGGVTKVEAESDEEPLEGSQLGETQNTVTPGGDQDTMSYPGDQGHGVMDDESMGYRVQGTFSHQR